MSSDNVPLDDPLSASALLDPSSYASTTTNASSPSPAAAVTRGESVYASYGQVFEEEKEEEREAAAVPPPPAPAPVAEEEQDPLSASSSSSQPAAPVNADPVDAPATAVAAAPESNGGGGGPGHILSPPPRPAPLPPISTSTSPPQPAPPATVSVSDPVLRSEPSLIPGVSRTYVSYRVETAFGGSKLASALASLPGGGIGGGGDSPPSSSRSSTFVAVRRRFKDVVLLGDALKLAHRGFCIPPRPDRALPLAGVLSGGGGNGSGVPATPPSATAASASASATPRHYSASVASAPDSGGLMGGFLGASNTDPAFVEARRSALEAYLNVVARHPALGESAVLAAWLSADGVFYSSDSDSASTAASSARETNLSYSAAWQSVAPARSPSLLEGAARLPRQLAAAALEGKPSSSSAVSSSLGGVPTAAEVGRSAAASGDLMRRLRELGVAVGQMEQGAGAGAGGDDDERQAEGSDTSSSSTLPPGEAELRRERRRVEARAAAVAAASAAAEKALSAAEVTGAALGDLGLALLKLARAEDDSVHARGGRHDRARAALNGPPTVLLAAAADARRAGGAALRGARLSRAAVAESARVLSPLHDELALAPALSKALREREAALLTLQTVDSELTKRKAALEAAGGMGVGEAASYSTPAIEALRNDVASLEAASAAAKAEYERVAGRNRSELERLGAERHVGLAASVQGFVAVGTAFEERRGGGWSEVASAAAEAAAEASGGGAPSD